MARQCDRVALAVAQTPAFKEGYEAELNKSAQAGGMLRRVGRMGAMAALPLAGFGAGEMYGSPTNFITRHWNKGPGEQASDQHLMNLMRLPLHEREMAMSDFDRRRKLSLQQALGPEWWQQHNRNMMYNMGGMGAGGSDLGLSYM